MIILKIKIACVILAILLSVGVHLVAAAESSSQTATVTFIGEG